MPTIRHYFYRSVKNFLLLAILMIGLALVVALLAWIASSKLHNALVLSCLYYFKEIGIGIAILFSLFWMYKARKVYKTEASFSQELIKMMPTMIIWIAIFGFGAIHIDNLLDGTDCQKYNYNDKLNGGSKEFYRKKYSINICGSGVNNSHFFSDSMDQVQLTITDEQGTLLAKRRYKVFWEAQPGHEPITIGKDKITYQDDEKQVDHTITMPPTLFDWIRARLPFSGYKLTLRHDLKRKWWPAPGLLVTQQAWRGFTVCFISVIAPH